MFTTEDPKWVPKPDGLPSALGRACRWPTPGGQHRVVAQMLEDIQEDAVNWQERTALILNFIEFRSFVHFMLRFCLFFFSLLFHVDLFPFPFDPL